MGVVLPSDAYHSLKVPWSATFSRALPSTQAALEADRVDQTVRLAWRALPAAAPS